jgi:hypothetical protein
MLRINKQPAVSNRASMTVNVARHIPNLVQVLPKLHLARIRAQLVEVRPQKHLAVQNLRTVLAQSLVNQTGPGGAVGRECPCRNVVLQKFAIHNVDNGRDQRLDVFRPRDEGFNVIYLYAGSLAHWYFVYLMVGVLLEKSKNECRYWTRASRFV